MTELSALNIKITGDASGLTAAVNTATTALGGLSAAVSSKVQPSVDRISTTFGRLGSIAQNAGRQISVAFSAIPSLVSRSLGSLNGLVGQFAANGKQMSWQLSQIVQQGSVTGQWAQAFAVQLGDIIPMVGGTGLLATGIGALAMVGLPLLANAFFSSSEAANELSAAAEHQKDVIDSLTASTYALRLERQALQSGAFLSGEQEALNEIVRLGHERVALEYELQQEMAKANDGMGVINQKQVEAIQLRLQENAAARAQAEALIENGRLETARIAAINLAKTAQQEVLKIMRQLQNSDISSPWQKVIGWIGQATAAAQSYAAASQTYGQVGARGDPRQFGANAGQTNTFNTSNFQLPAVSPATGGGGGGGGAAENPIQAELEALQEGLMSAEQLQMESYTRQQEVLNEALNQRLITQQEYQALMQQAESSHAFAMQQSVNQGVSQTLGHLGTLFQGSKKISAAIALANSWLAFTEVLKDPAYIGRPWARIAAAGAALSSGLNAVRAIKSASPGGGGAGGGTGAQAMPAQQNVQTLNFNVQNDQFGIGANLIRQIASQLNEAQRNGSTLIRATVA